MKKIIIATTLTATLTLTGCSKAFLEEYNDAPVSENNDKPAMRMSFPDGFSNVSGKCDGPNMVYVTMNGNGLGIAVVANDPRCVEVFSKNG